jgi:hypothetical protein
MNSEIRRLDRHRAFLTIDILGGLALIAIAGTMLTVLTARCMRASAQLAAGRNAIGAAETALANMQDGLANPTSDARVRIEIAPCPDGAVVAGHRWVQVIATVEGQSRAVSGLVPARQPDTAPAGGQR